jgi:SAM-dependent methyltransferase
VRLPGSDLAALLGDALPGDHAEQWQPERWLPGLRRRDWRVVDLGCGTGDSLDLFRQLDPEVRWTGVDVPDSAEAAERVRSDGEFVAFDGERIPLPDGAADLVLCKQVLEHVPRPEPLLADVRRVLTAGGVLVGSVSQLEPFHSRSTFNWTPYGLKLAAERAGLRLAEVRPGIDALTLIARRGLGRTRRLDRFWASESPLHRAIAAAGRGRPPREQNAAKLLFSGQFAFRCLALEWAA